MSKNIERVEKQQEYFDKYEKIIVTYFDGATKECTPDMWFIYEEKVSKIAKSINWVLKK